MYTYWQKRVTYKRNSKKGYLGIFLSMGESVNFVQKGLLLPLYMELWFRDDVPNDETRTSSPGNVIPRSQVVVDDLWRKEWIMYVNVHSF